MAIALTLSFLSCTKDTLENASDLGTIDITLAQLTNLEVADAILFHINLHREHLDLPSLEFDLSYATAYAVEHTMYMMNKKAVSHDFFYKRRNGMQARGANDVAENVAYGFHSGESVVNAWLDSPSHKVVVEGLYTHIGIGVIKAENGKYYFTCLFYD